MARVWLKAIFNRNLASHSTWAARLTSARCSCTTGPWGQYNSWSKHADANLRQTLWPWIFGCTGIIVTGNMFASHRRAEAESSKLSHRSAGFDEIEALSSPAVSGADIKLAAERIAEECATYPNAEKFPPLLCKAAVLFHKDLSVRLAVLGALWQLLSQDDSTQLSALNSGCWNLLLSLSLDGAARSGADGDAALSQKVSIAASKILPLLAKSGKVQCRAEEISQLLAIVTKSDGSIRQNNAAAALQALSTYQSNVPALLGAGATKTCNIVLKQQHSSQVPTAIVATVANFASYPGSWFTAAVHKDKDWQESVEAVAKLAGDHDKNKREDAVLALSSILKSKAAPNLSHNAAAAAIGVMSLLLMPSQSESLDVRLLAVQTLNAASTHKALSAMIHYSDTLASQLCIHGAVQALVAAAGLHRGDLDIRERITECFEGMLATSDDDCILRIGHFAAPVIVALAKTSDPTMQRRALSMIRKLCHNGFNKLHMQKTCGVIDDLVPLLARKDARQQALVTECLALLASTDNAVYGENARALGEARALRPLMVLCKSEDPVVHLNATWALAAMTACDRNHVPMRACIDTLLQVVERGTFPAQRYAIMAITNLAYTERTREILKVQTQEPMSVCNAKGFAGF